MKKILTILGIIIALVIVVTIVLNIKVANGSMESIFSGGEDGFAGCTETYYLNNNSYQEYDVYVKINGKLIDGKVDIFLIEGEWKDSNSSKVIEHYEYSEKGNFCMEYTFDKVSANDERQYVIIGSKDLEVSDFKLYSSSKVKLIDKIIPHKIEMIYP